LSAHRHRDPTGLITGFLFWGCFHCRPTIGGNLLRRESSTEPQSGKRRLDLLGTFYIADKGFEDAENHRRWQESYGAQLIHPPKPNSRKRSWSKLEAVGGRNTPEIVETVYGKLFNTFGLWGSELMSFRVCELAWRRGWRCTTSASGSTINSVVPDWPSPTCWDGELKIHTKRLRFKCVFTWLVRNAQKAILSRDAGRAGVRIGTPA
jgi:hypothetical protein